LFGGLFLPASTLAALAQQMRGQCFSQDLEARGIAHHPITRAKSDLYEALEAPLNAGEVELLNNTTLIEQAVCLVWRGQRIDHDPP
jgi:hypothetical protein